MASHYHVVFLLPDLNNTVCIGACPTPFPPSSAPSPAPAPVVFPAWAVSAPSLSPSPAPAPIVFSASPTDTVPLLSTYPETKHQLLRTLLVVVASVFATCALLLTYYIVLRRYRSLRHRRAAADAGQPPAPPATLARSDTDDELREDLLAAGAADQPYHVWHIRTVGLDERTIGAISAVAYRKGEGLVEGTDCAVCLGEFRGGDMLRLLPKCSHAFHIPCIDTWLRSHLNCPLCRAPILSPAPPPPATVAAANATSSSSPSSSSAASAVGDHPVSSQEEPEIWMRIDLGDGGSEDGGGRAGSGPPPAPEDGGNVSTTLQRVRRSVSMDPSALGGLLQRMGLVGAADEEGSKPISEEHPSAAPKERGRRRNNRRAASLMDAGPPEMERSMSSGGGRLFPSMFSGRTRGAILPL